MLRTALAGAVCALVAWSAPAAAQEVVGTITGTLDGVETQWLILQHPQGSQSEFMDWGAIHAVTLFGQPEGAGMLDTEGALMIDMNVPGTTAPLDGREVSVRYLTEGMFKGYASSYDREPVVKITALEKSGEGHAISGTVSAELGQTDGPGQQPDYADARRLQADFEATLPGQR